ncbi:hypothetical protein N7493_004376 [Penicillium malachiteum]|uniref:S-adenosyl-L-methionine-dependent methyltransferase n=1 Tax=Penicillium malachiteum TaxID=1324776 RepID=A0AAD6HNJ3_9EURO|nr:hypothetical protein N7493_004376 [Penicillium malachiteum]
MDDMPNQPDDPGPSDIEIDSSDIEVEISESESEAEQYSDGEESIKSTRSFYQNLPHVEENGRRYCDENYFMPNDETELTRLNIVHQIYLILQEGRLTLAPLPSNPRILDIGTGPGDWAIEMSAEYPDATIIASDLGIFDSGLGHVSLPNVDFQLADAQSQWTYHEPFDLIHIRGLSGAFNDWPAIYRQALAHLKSGGYLEVSEIGPAGETLSIEAESETPNLATLTSALRKAGYAAGYPRDLHHLRKEAFVNAGFTEINVIERTFPIGLWPEGIHDKTLGKMALIALLEGVEAHSLRPLTRFAEYTVSDAKELCERVQEEVLSAQRITGRVRIVMGRKPSSYTQRRDDVLARARARIQLVHERQAERDRD